MTTQAKLDVVNALAKNVVNVKYEDIPPDTLEITRKHTLDMLATIIGGSAAPGCRELVELIKEWGGRPESTILSCGYRVPAPNAAQANASMGHALDYDDTDDRRGHHAGVAVIPVCFAMAERKGKVSGREFITAVALGIDLSCRMALAARRKTADGWSPTKLYGYFAAAAAAGRLLGLDEGQMVNALGIAYEQASGNLQATYDSTLTKRMGAGFAARGGIVSALMAEKGITGAQGSLEGAAGLYHVYHQGSYDPEVLTADLGVRFEGAHISFKPYPSCRLTHPAIDAALALLKEHALKPEDIAEVIVYVGKNALAVTSTPLEIKRAPRNIVDAQFSVPWNVATALVHGKVEIKDFTADAIEESVVLQMAKRVTPKLDDKLSEDFIEPALVEIAINDGSVLSKRVSFPYGSPQNPVSWETIAAKLRDCASYAAKLIPEENLGMVIGMARRLEELDDVSSIVRLLS